MVSRLAAIYNVFDGEELLEGSIKQIRQTCDYVIAVYQRKSNTGEIYNGGFEKVSELKDIGLIDSIICYHPQSVSPSKNETQKRNVGLNAARLLGATHFISMDCDEYYDSKQFELHWQIISETPQIKATVAKMFTYFGKTTLRLSEPEGYYVPFICQLNRDTKLGNYNCGYYCDPTRKPNVKAIQVNIMMHHYSYVRVSMESLQRKVKNSSAYGNLKGKENEIYRQYKHCAVGMIPCIYNNPLIFTENHFDIQYGTSE